MTFTEFYKKELASAVTNLEQKRLSLNKKGERLLPFLLGFLFILVGVISYFFSQLFESYLAGFLIFFMGVVTCLAFKEDIKKLVAGKSDVSLLNLTYKKEVVSKLISYLNKDFSYRPEGCVTNEELEKSGLFHIGINTKVKTDDIISGKFEGNDTWIADVSLSSSLLDDDLGYTTQGDDLSDSISTQNYNGLVACMKTNTDDTLFLIPNEMTKKGGKETLTKAKILRDKSMSVAEQRQHNLKALAPLMRAYYWQPFIANFEKELTEHEVNWNEKSYLMYTDNTEKRDEILNNSLLKSLQQQDYTDLQALSDITAYKSFFQSINVSKLDQATDKKNIYALHSGYIWILFPSYSKNFELDLSYPIEERNIESIFSNLQFVLANLLAFRS